MERGTRWILVCAGRTRVLDWAGVTKRCLAGLIVAVGMIGASSDSGAGTGGEGMMGRGIEGGASAIAVLTQVTSASGIGD